MGYIADTEPEMLQLREEHSNPYRVHGWRNRLREAEENNWEALREIGDGPRHHLSVSATYILEDALKFMAQVPPGLLSAIVTDPPYGLEYEEKDHRKLKAGRGGVWRIPPPLMVQTASHCHVSPSCRTKTCTSCGASSPNSVSGRCERSHRADICLLRRTRSCRR
jgi:hypothetical protein